MYIGKGYNFCITSNPTSGNISTCFENRSSKHSCPFFHTTPHLSLLYKNNTWEVNLLLAMLIVFNAQ